MVILAAGKGKRMASDKPKVLHTLGGLPFLQRVVNSALKLNPKNIHVIHGNGGDIVKSELEHLPVNWVKQEHQLGTGHAVQQALPSIDEDEQVLILYGDVPLISSETLGCLLEAAPSQGIGLLVAEVNNPDGLGRIIRDQSNNIVKIVEHKDANEEQLKIHEINTGILTCPASLLKTWLPQLKNKNQQGEYYLTDVVSMAVIEKIPVIGVKALCPMEALGVNDLCQLSELERFYQYQRARYHALQGVRIADLNRLDIRGDETAIGKGTLLEPNVILDGKIEIGENAYIGPGVVLKNTTVGDGVRIEANSVIEGAVIANYCQVGPFARLRPGTVLEHHAKVGNFVETKKTIIGEGSKASHLTYLGDAVIGKDVNIGAGTITCNYDGVNKSTTQIHDNAFIGSNSSLVAPISIGKGATVGAGSTLTQDAPDNALTLGRNRQRTIQGWKRPTKKKKIEETS